MTAHSLYHKRLRTNRKGYSAIIGTIFMVLIVLFLYFNVFTFSLNRNTDFQDVISRSEQLDADRNAEQITIANSFTTGLNGQILVHCTLINNGSVPAQLVRLWVQDNNLNRDNVGNNTLSNTLRALQPGGIIPDAVFQVNIDGASASDSFYFWFVTFRGNIFAATVNT